MAWLRSQVDFLGQNEFYYVKKAIPGSFSKDPLLYLFTQPHPVGVIEIMRMH